MIYPYSFYVKFERARISKKNGGEWAREIDIRTTKYIPGSGRSTHGNIPTYYNINKGRTFVSPRVLTEGDLNFCIRSSPLVDQSSYRHAPSQPTTKTNLSALANHNATSTQRRERAPLIFNQSDPVL